MIYAASILPKCVADCVANIAALDFQSEAILPKVLR